MSMTKVKALDVLELPMGADIDTIRTAYKRLATKWFPEKHNNSTSVVKKFFDITSAYKVLSNNDENATCKSKEEVYELYFTIVLNKQLTETAYRAHRGAVLNGDVDSDDEHDDDSDSCEDCSDLDYNDEDELYRHIGPRKRNHHLHQDGLNNNALNVKLSPEEIEKNAQELISEEEKEKQRREKRRAKKKRQRQNKKTEKQQKVEYYTKNKKSKTGDGGSKDKKTHLGSSGSETEGLDPDAAVFTAVVGKKKRGGGGAAGVSDSVVEAAMNGVLPGSFVVSGHAPSSRASRVEAASASNGVHEESAEDLSPVILQSHQLAREGNHMASSGHYQSAIDLFTEACRLHPTDFRYYGNRSYCYDRIDQFEKALKDADKALRLSADWPKGYFRKGRALAGLKLYSDAEKAFLQVLKLDTNCNDAVQELIRVRVHQIMEMGFSRQQAEDAIEKHKTVQGALDALLAGVVDSSLANEIYESDDEDYGSLVNTHSHVSGTHTSRPHRHLPPQPQQQQSAPVVTHSPATRGQHSSSSPAITVHHANLPVGLAPDLVAAALAQSAGSATVGAGGAVTSTSATSIAAFSSSVYHPATAIGVPDHKMDPKNPEGYTALWVGNVLPEVSQSKLTQMFSKYGPVTSIRMLPDKFCAFVNFKSKEDAGKAMKGLQSSDCAGQQLLIKFPDNPANGSVMMRKDATRSSSASNVAKSSVKASNVENLDSKSSGPVNGDECYFWRTTGCQFGPSCRWKHLPASKGTDRQPWQKPK